MRSFINKLFIALVLFSVSAFSQGMKFEEKATWSQVLATAKKTGKPIFVDAYTTWCGPCKWMSKNIFPGDSAGSFYNANYVNYKLDMEKGEGIEFAKKYEVRFFPTYLFFDKDGNLVHRSGGSKNATAFVKDGKNGIDPNHQLYTLEKNFKDGKRDITTMRNYAFALMDAGLTSEALAEEFLKAVPENEKFNKESFGIVSNNSSLKSDSFKFLLAHKKDFTSVTAVEYERAVSSKYYEEVRAAAGENNKSRLMQLQSQVENNLGPVEWKEMQLAYYSYTKDFNSKFAVAEDLFKDPAYNDHDMMNSLAWDIFEMKDATNDQIHKAVEWSKRSIDLVKDWAYLDTYANLLYRTGKTQEAKKYAEEAIELAKSKGEDAKDTEALLKQINETKK